MRATKNEKIKIKRFEYIAAWQKPQDFAMAIYLVSSELSGFGFKDQFQSTSIFISNNIAAGFNRQGDKEFTRFLYILRLLQ